MLVNFPTLFLACLLKLANVNPAVRVRLGNVKFQVKNIGVMERVLSSCCEETSQISINEAKTSDGAYYLELKVPSRSRLQEGFWYFLEKYGFRYGDMYSRPLLPSEVMAILRKVPQETKRKLSAKGYFPQDGYILQHLPVPPNCLSVPDISDGISTMSTDYSITLLKKVLRQVEIIKIQGLGSQISNLMRLKLMIYKQLWHSIFNLGAPASYCMMHDVMMNDLASRDVDTRFGVNKEINASSTKAWLEKMKTLFIRKGSGFSSRSVITGDPFKGVSEIGLPFEIAQKITFEERVNQHNMQFLQKLVDEKLCLTYRDGLSTYSLREGSKGHTFLRPGQVVHRRIMDGDIVFINRPPTTHKHSLQALSVYVHDDHTVKINPLICGPLSADFDGDCIHLFYPQSLEAKAEVVELFSVEKQLLSSHTGNFNLQLATDSLLSLKILLRNYFLNRAAAQQLAMFVPSVLPKPAVVKSDSGPLWTVSQILQTTLPSSFDCSGERHIISKSEILSLEFNRDVMASILNDIVTSLFFLKGPKEVLRFFNSIQPLLMESLYSEGFSVSLRDFFLPRDVLESIQENIQKISPLMYHLRAAYSESIALQLDTYLRSMKIPVTNFVLKSSAIGHLIDSKSESALSKVVQQIGFLGMQISDRGKFYSDMLVKDMSSLFQKKYPSCDDYPTEEFGLVGRPLFRGLDPYQEMVHSISSREVIVRSTRGLTEPGTLFKNLMAILRDVVICYDGTVRNMCSNSIIQFEYGVSSANIASEFCAGDPVGVLAATAMSNPAYKAVLDSSPSSNSSWEMMKEILLCGVSFKNDISDRRVILYLNSCDCGRKHCQETAALIVKNQLKKVSLKDTAIEFLIECIVLELGEGDGSGKNEYIGHFLIIYRSQMAHDSSEIEIDPGLVGHIHLNKTQLIQSNISMHSILEQCQDTINRHQKKKKVGNLFKKIELSFSDCCSFCQSSKSKWTDLPCIQFSWQARGDLLERASDVLADTVCPVLLQTIIKGVTESCLLMLQNTFTVSVYEGYYCGFSADTKSTWIRSPCKSPKGELALDIILEKEAVRKSGDAWRVVMDSCLPVIHLIDTRRSITYAIKQVQELLGISCAFEQAVQRLSTSVTMVTKGVLKDHLLLLGNSMTCAGTLIGFNAGGIKALSKSLSVQVPFMNATLFTPRKCFERAAEKCHVDNLSSIVGSCAWGKHVSVGTGSPFEILWDTRKAELSPDKEIDVYNFLHLVNSSSRPEDMATSCLGAEIEDLDQEDDFIEYDPSPVRDPGLDKPTFEDGFEYRPNGDDNDGLSKEDAKEPEGSWSSWTKKVDFEENDWTKKAGQSTWEKKVNSEENDWTQKPEQSTWGKKVNSEENDWNKKPEQSTWGKKVNSEENNWTEKPEQSPWGKKVNSEENDWTNKPEESTWGKKVTSEENDWKKMGEQSAWAEEAQNGTAWGKKVDSDVGGGWAKKDEQNKWGSGSSERRGQSSHSRDSNEGGWGKASTPKTNNQASWGRDTTQAEYVSAESQEDGLWSSASVARRETALDASSEPAGWNALGSGTSSLEVLDDPWGAKVANQATHSKPSNAWGSSKDVWGSPNINTPSEKDTQSQWGKKSSWEAKDADQAIHSKPSNTWGASDDWGKLGSQSPTGKKKESPFNNWGSSQKQPNDSVAVQGWGSTKVDTSAEKDVLSQLGKENPWDKVGDQATESKPSNAWGSSTDWGKSDSQSPTGQKQESSFNNWGSEQKQSNETTVGQGWGSPKVDNSSEKDVRPQWGRGKGRGWGRGGRSRESSQGRGFSNDGEWKNKRPRAVDDPNAPALFSVTRQRLDSFTVEEQDALSEIEPIMKNIRKIMNQTGYNDGDPLSADDQTFIIDNVFSYHPDKALKMGAGIDYIMLCLTMDQKGLHRPVLHLTILLIINWLAGMESSRTVGFFYAVSVDGSKADFSYRKCLENFIKGKYPDKAEAFIAKYFKKSQPRAGWNRDRPLSKPEPPAGIGTPLLLQTKLERRCGTGCKLLSQTRPAGIGTPLLLQTKLEPRHGIGFKLLSQTILVLLVGTKMRVLLLMNPKLRLLLPKNPKLRVLPKH
ncbi:UNVERIFIED_CONTAM: DNA-directed RNA polymerase V subunit [Sesamum radiatum]|uniref:DNA-directed RNA polymerase n=1 Tax=Sesamum radiatum TaxID=300843 RepID=A0AAW2VHB5_SESRA